MCADADGDCEGDFLQEAAAEEPHQASASGHEEWAPLCAKCGAVVDGPGLQARDGSMLNPDGAVLNPDGAVLNPDGAVLNHNISAAIHALSQHMGMEAGDELRALAAEAESLAKESKLLHRPLSPKLGRRTYIATGEQVPVDPPPPPPRHRSDTEALCQSPPPPAHTRSIACGSPPPPPCHAPTVEACRMPQHLFWGACWWGAGSVPHRTSKNPDGVEILGGPPLPGPCYTFSVTLSSARSPP